MKHVDEAISFACGDATLLGILSRPEVAESTGVVVIVGGPQYRVGSHRQFLLVARDLASAGYPVLRFDHRGMGDSSGTHPGFESISPDIDVAIGALLQRVPELKHVVLWGLCDGASAALLYCHDRHDPRVHGLCLLNPWVRSETSLATTHVKHYYLERVLSREFWAKFTRGNVGPKALGDFLRSLRITLRGAASLSRRDVRAPASFQQRMASAWMRFEGSLLLILSGRDYTAKEFSEQVLGDPRWAGALARPHLTRADLAESDHTFSDAASRNAVSALTLNWLANAAGSKDARPSIPGIGR